MKASGKFDSINTYQNELKKILSLSDAKIVSVFLLFFFFFFNLIIKWVSKFLVFSLVV